MPEFLNVAPPQQAWRTLLKHLPPPVASRTRQVATNLALGEITAAAVHSPEDLPAFPRSTMDGFSVRAADTFGASEGLPAYFTVVGEVPMGATATVKLGMGEADVAYTGGMLAHEADAVVMVEHTQQVNDNTIEVVRPVAPGENVLGVGEDVRQGDLVLPAGHLLRPQTSAA